MEELPSEIVITPVDYNYCISRTIKGKQCGRKPKPNSHYCGIHMNVNKFEKPKDCPICMKSIENIIKPLSCGHWVHKHCVLRWKDRCPICRKKIKLTDRERNILNSNNLSNLNSVGNIVITVEINNQNPDQPIDENMIQESLADLIIQSALMSLRM